mmetsp:Transcript_53817/g.149665  ORF Transcript_53817/g.149665 Transcript_53817/m.149665 type:complete len:241 (-) Transcript_53817:1786-2508(-)
MYHSAQALDNMDAAARAAEVAELVGLQRKHDFLECGLLLASANPAEMSCEVSGLVGALAVGQLPAKLHEERRARHELLERREGGSLGLRLPSRSALSASSRIHYTELLVPEEDVPQENCSRLLLASEPHSLPFGGRPHLVLFFVRPFDVEADANGANGGGILVGVEAPPQRRRLGQLFELGRAGHKLLVRQRRGGPAEEREAALRGDVPAGALGLHDENGRRHAQVPRAQHPARGEADPE